MADKLAGNMIKASSQEGWRAPGIEYYKVHGQSHAFEGFPTKDVEAEKATVAAADAMLSKDIRLANRPFFQRPQRLACMGSKHWILRGFSKPIDLSRSRKKTKKNHQACSTSHVSTKMEFSSNSVKLPSAQSLDIFLGS